jgi:hypothetical protein
VDTITTWVLNFEIAKLQSEDAMMKREEELQREKELEARIKELEATLSQLKLDKLMLETILEVASEMYGEDFQKKYGAMSLKDLIDKGK